MQNKNNALKLRGLEFRLKGFAAIFAATDNKTAILQPVKQRAGFPGVVVFECRNPYLSREKPKLKTKMKNSKAEGAEFLRKLGLFVLIAGALAALLLVVAALEDPAFFAYVAGVLVSSLFLFGVCTNLASINDDIHKLYLMKFKEFQKDKEAEIFDFKETPKPTEPTTV